jgi:hypothetical protein
MNSPAVRHLAIKHSNYNNPHSIFKDLNGTMVFELPTREELENLFKQHGTATLMNVGVVRLHPRDSFNKKLGVKCAKEKMSLVPVYLTQVEIRNTKHIYHFQAKVPNRCPAENDTQVIQFGISTIRESDRAVLVYGNFTYEDDLS